MPQVKWSLGLGVLLALAAVALPWVKSTPSPVVAPSVPGVAASPPPVAPPPPVVPPPPTLEGTGRIRVRTLSAGDSRPLAGVTVALMRGAPDLTVPLEAARTDASGEAVFPAPRAGVFAVCARGAGHAEACEDVGLVAGGSLSVELRLPPGAGLVGQVLLEDGSPARGVRLAAEEEVFPGRMPTEAWTDAEGRFRLEGVTPGPLRIFPFTSEGRGEPRHLEHVEVGEVARLDIQLAGFTPLTVHPVREREGRDDVVASVSASVPLRLLADGSWVGTVESGERTVFVTGRRGDHSVMGWTPVTLSPGVPATVQARFGLQRSAKVIPIVRGREFKPLFLELAGHVLLPDGSPAPGAHVGMETPRDLGPCGNVPRSFSDIRFEGSGFVVRPMTGERKVYAWLEDGRAGSITVKGSEGERVVADIRLEETGAVAGVLELAEDRMPGEVESLSIDETWSGAWQFTRPDGAFFVAGLSPGEHSLETSHGPVRFTVRARERTELGRVKR